MITTLAAWHYPHRTMEENIIYFSEKGFKGISLLGSHTADMLREGRGEAVAALIKKYDLTLTVHGKMPSTHNREAVTAFEEEIRLFGQWQKNFGVMDILSFDVAGQIRDNIVPYGQFVMDTVPGITIAVEDVGLNENEYRQMEVLGRSGRFASLVDIGHMFLRLTAQKGDEVWTAQKWHQCFVEALRAMPLSIAEIHLHNNDGRRDMHWFLEEGELDIPMISRVLDEIGYDAVLTIESAPGFQFPCYGDEADTKILRTWEYWKNIRGE